ncbi:MAG: BtpA/SgcQ family protein [Cyanobacteriota bacterium]
MLEKLFGSKKPIIGVVHLLPLPSSANFSGNFHQVVTKAEQEAAAIASAGLNGIIIENYFDIPFVKDNVDPAVVASMSLITKRIMHLTDKAIGINVLRNDARSALAIAFCTGAKFIRVNILTGAMITDSGIIEAAAPTLLPYREFLKANDIKIFADVMVKHAYPMGTPYPIEEMAKETIHRGLADVLIVSGIATGSTADIKDVEKVKNALPDVPVLIGSGLNHNNAKDFLSIADGAIVATSIKREKGINSSIDVTKAEKLLESICI